MTKETNNNEAKDWLLAGVFTVTLGAVLAALFYYLDDLMAGLFIIVVLSIMMSVFYFLEKNEKKQSSKQPALNQEHHNDKRNE